MFADIHPSLRLAAIVLAGLALSAVTGLAFASWIEHAPAIFLTLVEQGMAWCF
ncbi:hypothetical protein [Aerobium aerolatum]|uniref:hypothetical protein n=1 Tax=Aerobium aerolatum TaxID=561088 RepID=UPI001587F9ED|nr:hypothetical protein [Aquamicrobium aerolatum]